MSEREMFGGVAFLVAGKMACGIIGRDLMVRVGPAAWQAALGEPHARPMDFTGKPLNGYVYVAPAGVTTDAKLKPWVERGVALVDSMNVDPPRRAKETAAAGKALGPRKSGSAKKAKPRKKTGPAKKAKPRKRTATKRKPNASR